MGIPKAGTVCPFAFCLSTLRRTGEGGRKIGMGLALGLGFGVSSLPPRFRRNAQAWRRGGKKRGCHPTGFTPKQTLNVLFPIVKGRRTAHSPCLSQSPDTGFAIASGKVNAHKPTKRVPTLSLWRTGMVYKIGASLLHNPMPLG